MTVPVRTLVAEGALPQSKKGKSYLVSRKMWGNQRFFRRAAGHRPALVCLAGVVNYRDERSPTGAVTPTVVEG